MADVPAAEVRIDPAGKRSLALIGKPAEPKLAGFDLDALFDAQRATLATVREVQMVLTGAMQAITEVQYGYLEQALTSAKARSSRARLAPPEVLMADLKGAAESARAITREILDVTADAQKRLAELLAGHLRRCLGRNGTSSPAT
jgi:FAD/FMN-containing dehydrogenase